MLNSLDAESYGEPSQLSALTAYCYLRIVLHAVVYTPCFDEAVVQMNAGA